MDKIEDVGDSVKIQATQPPPGDRRFSFEILFSSRSCWNFVSNRPFQILQCTLAEYR